MQVVLSEVIKLRIEKIKTMNPDIELQYQCSFWNKRYRPDQCVVKHEEHVSEASKRTRNLVPFRTVQYGKNLGQLMDIFGEDSLKKECNIFVYIHGGYWQSLNREISSYCVKPLYDNGIVTIIPDYDLAPKVSMGVIVEEIKDLAKFILKMAEENGNIGVWFGGHSAGAHLAATLLQDNWLSSISPYQRNLFKGLVLISGIYDLEPILQTTINDEVHMTSTDIQKYSPLHKTETMYTNINILVAFAEYDSKEFHRQSQEFSQALEKHGIQTAQFLINGEDHFSIVEKLQDPDYKLTKLIIQSIEGSLFHR